MPFNIPNPPYGHQINVNQEQIKRGLDAQKEANLIKQEADRRKREMEAAQRVRDSSTSQRR